MIPTKRTPLATQWLGGSLKRPAIVKIDGLGPRRQWWESCPEHGGTPHPTWDQAQVAMEAHLSGVMHPAPEPESTEHITATAFAAQYRREAMA